MGCLTASGWRIRVAVAFLMMLQSTQCVYIKYHGFQVQLESVKKLSELEQQLEQQVPRLGTQSLLPAVCRDPALPLDLQPICASQDATNIFKGLKAIAVDDCELCVNVACTGCF